MTQLQASLCQRSDLLDLHAGGQCIYASWTQRCQMATATVDIMPLHNVIWGMSQE
jgi:hypothetical protein